MKTSSFIANLLRSIVAGLILSTCSLTSAGAQEEILISLEDVLEIGGADNLTILKHKELQALSLAEYTKAKNWWLPEVFGGIQTHQLWGAAMNSDGRFFLDVNRQNLWGGIGLNTAWDFSEKVYDTKTARLNSEARPYISEAKRNEQLLQMIYAYYDLMTYQLHYKAYHNLVNQSDSIIQQINTQVDAGIGIESDLLLAKGNKNHLQFKLLNAKKEYLNASETLRYLLGIEETNLLSCKDQFMLPLDFSDDLNSTRETSHENRPELMALELQNRALKIQQKKYSTGLLIPELNISTYGSYTGRISGQVSPMIPANYPTPQQLYPTGALDVSLLWKIPLADLIYKGDKKTLESKLRLKEIESQQLKLQITQEIANATSQIQLGKEQIAMAKEAMDFTTKALNQRIERQKLGISQAFEVFQAQQYFLQARLDYLNAVSSFNKAQYALKHARGDRL